MSLLSKWSSLAAPLRWKRDSPNSPAIFPVSSSPSLLSPCSPLPTSISSPCLSFAAISISLLSQPNDSRSHLPIVECQVSFAIFYFAVLNTTLEPCLICRYTSSITALSYTRQGSSVTPLYVCSQLGTAISILRISNFKASIDCAVIKLASAPWSVIAFISTIRLAKYALRGDKWGEKGDSTIRIIWTFQFFDSPSLALSVLWYPSDSAVLVFASHLSHFLMKAIIPFSLRSGFLRNESWKWAYFA